MHTSKKLRKGQIISLLMIPVFILGIVLSAYTVIFAKENVITEYDRHLDDFARYVDHGVATLAEHCLGEMTLVLENSRVQEAEKKFLSQGDGSELENLFKITPLTSADYVVGVIILKDGRTVLSGTEFPAESYKGQYGRNDSDFSLIYSSLDGENYLGMLMTSLTSDLEYCVLIDIDDFYEAAVPKSTWQNNWIVLYEYGSGLILQNESDRPDSFVSNREIIRKRQDGYTLILEAEENQVSSVQDYVYTSSQNVENSSRIAIIPSGETENGVFAVGVAVYDNSIQENNIKSIVFMLVSTGLIVLSIGVIVFFAFHSGRREEELKNELSSMEQERETTKEMLSVQEEVYHRQKLEDLGTLTAGVAHEFNNLLAPIMGNSLLILEKIPEENTEVYDSALSIYDASQKAKTLVSRVSSLTRKSSQTKMRPISARELFNGALLLSRPSMPKNIQINQTIRTEETFLGEESQLSHMILNFIINSIQAMTPQGGVLSLEAEDDGNQIFIRVRDTGPGFPKDKINSVFEPFFTTKEVGKGTGLGLALAQRIALNHGGRLEASNLPTGGACMTFIVHIFRE